MPTIAAMEWGHCPYSSSAYIYDHEYTLCDSPCYSYTIIASYGNIPGDLLIYLLIHHAIDSATRECQRPTVQATEFPTTITRATSTIPTVDHYGSHTHVHGIKYSYSNEILRSIAVCTYVCICVLAFCSTGHRRAFGYRTRYYYTTRIAYRRMCCSGYMDYPTCARMLLYMYIASYPWF